MKEISLVGIGLGFILCAAAGVMGGCSYAGVATAQDGTLYVTRNSAFFGGGRRVFVCKPRGSALNCDAAPDSP